ncbi:PABP-interacting PAM2 motif-containing protein, partial [Endozoicomonas sp. SESOKO3]|uniref:PABP-interacting PAM2 motif-containing protein n=1 Tax=Endozoicomonas sp. SESOKO3 TaxID=2828744 RepID=UPI0021494E60
MSYGLPPDYGSTSQPSQYRLPDANQDANQDIHQETMPESKLNPCAQPFVPRGSGGDDDRSSGTPPTIRDRRTTAHRASFSQRPHPSGNKQSPKEARENINQAYITLKNKQFSDAEEKFQAVIDEFGSQLSQADYQNSVIGLARSLNEQTPEKQEEACSHLEELRSKGRLTKLGASTIP